MLRGDLRLADRGYFDREYLNAVSRAGGHDVVCASASNNPMVRRAYDSRGEELRQTRGRRLKAWAVATDERVDPDVAWGTGEVVRIVVRHGLAATGDDHLLTRLDLVRKLAEVHFRLSEIHRDHDTFIVVMKLVTW